MLEWLKLIAEKEMYYFAEMTWLVAIDFVGTNNNRFKENKSCKQQ